MRRIVRLVEISQVAAYAGCGRSREFSAHVTGCAIERRVRARQGKASELQMVELRTHPVVHRVALLAARRQIQLNVVQAGSLRVNKVSLMARVTGGGKSLELPDRSALVAGSAIQRGMRPDQREAVDVLVDLLDGNVPSLDGMALLTVRAHLPLVNIRMAVSALRSHIRENQLGMALRAADAFVHTA
jgi:hypothetical protein